MINLNSRIARLKYQAEIEREMQSLERVFVGNIRSILGRQFLDTARLLEFGIFNVQHIDYQIQRMKTVFVNHYRRTASIFFKRVNTTLNSEKSVFLYEMKETNTDIFWTAISTWINEHAVDKIVGVNNTTKELLKNLINKRMSEGKTLKEIAKEIRIISKTINSFRAMSIAMTETHGCTVFSIDEAMKSTGMVSNREWMNAGDERVRTSPFDHVAANGEIVGPYEKFVRTGEPLNYPGDPEGSASNVIRCRCLILYSLTRKSVIAYLMKRRELMRRKF